MNKNGYPMVILTCLVLFVIFVFLYHVLSVPPGFTSIGSYRYVNTEDGTVWLRSGYYTTSFTQMFNADGTPKLYIPITPD